MFDILLTTPTDRNTALVMAQGIAGGLPGACSRIPNMSRMEPVSLFRVGLATPCSTVVQIVLFLGVCFDRCAGPQADKSYMTRKYDICACTSKTSGHPTTTAGLLSAIDCAFTASTFPHISADQLPTHPILSSPAQQTVPCF